MINESAEQKSRLDDIVQQQIQTTKNKSDDVDKLNEQVSELNSDLRQIDQLQQEVEILQSAIIAAETEKTVAQDEARRATNQSNADVELKLEVTAKTTKLEILSKLYNEVKDNYGNLLSDYRKQDRHATVAQLPSPKTNGIMKRSVPTLNYRTRQSQIRTGYLQRSSH